MLSFIKYLYIAILFLLAFVFLVLRQKNKFKLNLSNKWFFYIRRLHIITLITSAFFIILSSIDIYPVNNVYRFISCNSYLCSAIVLSCFYNPKLLKGFLYYIYLLRIIFVILGVPIHIYGAMIGGAIALELKPNRSILYSKNGIIIEKKEIFMRGQGLFFYESLPLGFIKQIRHYPNYYLEEEYPKSIGDIVKITDIKIIQRHPFKANLKLVVTNDTNAVKKPLSIQVR